MESNNLAKKINKKMRKHQYTINKETGALPTDNPTSTICICNAGQINGLTEEIIVENFHEYGPLDRVLLIPGKSCAFLRYKTVSSASKAFEATHTKLNIAQDGKPIYLSYIAALPETLPEKIYDRLPPGLTIIKNFITEEEEALLLSLCSFEEEASSMKHRQVKHFGYEFRYDINNVDKDKPLLEKIPEDCDFLWERFPNFNPDQLTVNQYKPGQGIPSHVDTHSAFEEPLLSLSLSSSVVMEFKKKETICVLLPRRSLLVMAGESRYDWTHGIVPRKFDFYYTQSGCCCFKRETRVSFTFRKVRRGECDCSYMLNCDSYAKKAAIGRGVADKLENLHVHDVYEDIAGHFSETRHKPWPNVLSFVDRLERGAVLVDVGCGNGKYFGHNDGIVELGTDRSFKLNQLCKDRGFEVFASNCLNLPLKDNSADAVISIAVIHHLSTEERRLQALAEITRILRPEGEALVYVWAKQQVKDHEKSTYIKQDRKNRRSDDLVSVTRDEVCVVQGVSLPVHTNRMDFSHSDILVPWKLKGEESGSTFLRFYHVFEEGELDGLCQQISNVSVVKSYYDQGNYCVLFKKI